MTDRICVGSFNILADGLSSGEFLCEGGDAGSTDWAVRKDKIVSILANMLQSCEAVVTQENDHFIQIFSELREVYSLDVGGVFGTNVKKPSKANQLRLAKQRKAVNLPEVKAHVPSSSYEECNRYYRLGAPEGTTSLRSFRQESASFGADFATMYLNDPDDLYQSDDGVGVYYRMDKLQLDSVHLPGRTVQSTSSPNVTLVTNMDYVLACTFQLLNPTFTGTSDTHSSSFTLYGAHLSSGEDVTKEHARCRQLYAILDDAQHRVNPVIAMDSNSSIYYEAAYPDTLIDNNDSSVCTKPLSSSATDDTSISTSDSSADSKCYIPGKLSRLIEQFNFIDAVGADFQTGNECFKMRHGQGGQPSKHYQFMFDTIDKILVPKSTQLVPYRYERSAFGFTRYDPTLREQLVNLRTSLTARQELETMCRNSDKINSTTCTEIAFGQEDMLSGLYPNKQAPSYHPPVSCSFLLG
eukprot:gene8132-9685_t